MAICRFQPKPPQKEALAPKAAAQRLSPAKAGSANSPSQTPQAITAYTYRAAILTSPKRAVPTTSQLSEATEVEETFRPVGQEASFATHFPAKTSSTTSSTAVSTPVTTAPSASAGYGFPAQAHFSVLVSKMRSYPKRAELSHQPSPSLGLSYPQTTTGTVQAAPAPLR